MSAWQLSNERCHEGRDPDACRRVAVIAEDDENGNRRQRLDLLVGVVRRTTTRFDEDEPFGYRRIQQRRCRGETLPIASAPSAPRHSLDWRDPTTP